MIDSLDGKEHQKLQESMWSSGLVCEADLKLLSRGGGRKEFETYNLCEASFPSSSYFTFCISPETIPSLRPAILILVLERGSSLGAQVKTIDLPELSRSEA